MDAVPASAPEGLPAGLIAHLAHQLRTPLQPLVMLTHLMAEQAGTSSALPPGACGLLLENLDLLTAMIDELADCSRLLTGRDLGGGPGEELAGVIAPLFPGLYAEAAERGMTITTPTLPGGTLLPGVGERWRRLLRTLLRNAIVHGPRGAAIHLSIERADATCAVVVSAPGRGFVRPPDLDRLPQTPSPTASTLGVGLVLGRAFAQAHGGSLTLQSPGEGQGATARLELPVRSLTPGMTSGSPARA